MYLWSITLRLFEFGSPSVNFGEELQGLVLRGLELRGLELRGLEPRVIGRSVSLMPRSHVPVFDRPAGSDYRRSQESKGVFTRPGRLPGREFAGRVPGSTRSYPLLCSVAGR
jgi:hypothetical protein